MELNFLSRINAQQVRRFGKGNSGRNKRISICTVPLSFSLSLSLSSIKELQTMAYFRTRERRGRIGNSKERPVLALPHRLIDSRRLPASTSTFSENAITPLSLSLSLFLRGEGGNFIGAIGENLLESTGTGRIYRDYLNTMFRNSYYLLYSLHCVLYCCDSRRYISTSLREKI